MAASVSYENPAWPEWTTQKIGQVGRCHRNALPGPGMSSTTCMNWPSILAFTESNLSMGQPMKIANKLSVVRKLKIARFFRTYHSNPSVVTPLQYEKYQQVRPGVSPYDGAPTARARAECFPSAPIVIRAFSE